jgi:4-amino-4-deoxy-L-arabinose transferase-like glycosyltransferase
MDPLSPTLPAPADLARPTSSAPPLDSAAPSRLSARLAAVPWPLFALLAVQAALSARLLRLNAAFVDEATYIYAGHQVLDHWIHGWSVPAYATYFSGAPTIYPPLAAAVDHFGGLTAVRVMSMLFMLWGTAMLWAAARRLFGRLAAFAGCALFVSLGSTQALGAFATYDALAFALLVTGAYCALRAAEADEEAPWWPLCATLLALANATKYTTALWDPFVLALLVICVYRRHGLGAAVRRAAGVAALTGALLALGLAVGGNFYISGITSTTLSRAAGGYSRSLILHQVWQWIGWVLVLAALGLLVAAYLRRSRQQLALVAVLLLAGLAAPLNQLRISTDTSLQKHVDFGAWFACIAAGYVLASLARALPGLLRKTPVRVLTTGVLTGAVLALTVSPGLAQGDAFFHEWPDGRPVAAAMQRFVAKGKDQYLVEDYDVEAYYLQHEVSWNQWNNTWSFTFYSHDLHKSISGLPAYIDAVKNHYFALIVLDFGDTAPVDHAIVDAINACHDSCGYHIISQVPYTGAAWKGQSTVWQYQGVHS